jgi:hypothetical protein
VTISNGPAPILIAFVGFIALGVWLIARAAREAAAAAGYSTRKQNGIFYGILSFGLVWATYASVLALSGFLYVPVRPPRQVVFTTLPLVVFVLLVIPRTALYRTLLEHSRTEDLIRIHILRFAGAMFISLYLLDQLPGEFALIAGTGDLITAASSYLVAHYVFVKRTLSIRWAYAWNIFGLADILLAISIVIVLNFQAAASASEPVPGSILELATFPLAIGPAFATATLVFLHISIFRKLRAISRANRPQPVPART